MSLLSRKRRRARRRFERSAPSVVIYACPGGCPPGECDTLGPGEDVSYEGGGGYSSVTCSKCGQSAISRAMWEGP